MLTDVTELRKRQEEEFHHQLAHEVQQRFYSASIRLPGFDIAGAAYPVALTGGDYFDFIEQPGGCAYLAIGDVSGHGFGAALQMATTRAYIRAYAQCESNVGAILSRGNNALAADLDGPQFMTLLLIRLDPANRTLEYASAGHSPGYVLSAKGDVRLVLEATGPPCGLLGDSQFPTASFGPLEDGDTLVLMTDGITETTNGEGEEFGVAGVLDAARRQAGGAAEEVLRAIHASARAFAGLEPQKDDMTLVVCKTRTAA